MRTFTRPFIWITSTILVVLAACFWITNRNPNSIPPLSSAPPEIASSKINQKRPPGPNTSDEIKNTAQAKPCERTVLTYLDLSRPPTQAELIAAGNLGEPLTPTRSAEPVAIADAAGRTLQEKDNLAFGTAIQAWNQHRYKEAFELFEQHSTGSPNSPWAAESRLHLGCFCQYNGRMAESAEWFDGILSTVDPNSEMYHKAKLRRSILMLDQGNLEGSLQGFTEMIKNDPDPGHQSYASYWIREIALLKKNETALRDCGQKALARVAEISGASAEANALREMTAAGPHGFNAEELHMTALSHGLNSSPVRADTALNDLPLPFVAHYRDHHYVTVDHISDSEVKLFDSRVGQATMPRAAFLKQWSGFALIFSEPAETAAIYPAENLDAIVGGCCGHPRSPSGLGDDDCNKNCGMPGWSVNPVNFNFRVSDTPIWWNSPVGPSVSMSLLFNSLDSLNNYEPFGEKWSFEYASYLLITPGGQIQVRDGDGRLETFTAGSTAGIYPVSHTAPAGDFRKLVEVADHVFELTHQDGTIYHYGIPASMTGTSSVPLLLSVEDRHGNAVSITHNAQGSITAVSHSMLPDTTPSGGTPVNRAWAFVYDIFEGHSRVIRIDDPFGRSTYFGYHNDDSANPGRNLRTQTDMGGLAYGYDYTTKLSQDAISTNYSQTSFASATNELFITAIHTPKGTTSILTEPSDGQNGLSIPQEERAKGYGTNYPPIGFPEMWTNYRIRITNPENKTEEYHFEGLYGYVYHRDPIQLNRPTGQSVAPDAGAYTLHAVSVIGGVEGKIVGSTRGSGVSAYNLTARVYNPTSLKTTAFRDLSGNWNSYEYNTNGTLKTLIPAKAGSSPTDSYKTHYTYEANGLDSDKTTRYLNGTLRTLLDIDYWPGTRDVKQTTDALGHITSYVWHPNGLPISVTDATTGGIMTYIYDQGAADLDGYPTWRLLKVFNGTASTGVLISETGYDDIGRPAMVTDTSGDYVQSTYDDLNRLNRTDASDNSFSEQIWECCYVGETRSGAVVAGQDRVTARTKYVHDRRGLLIRSIDTAGKITRLGYDDVGRMKSLTDPMDRLTQWTYDGFGRKDKKIYSDTTYEQTFWSNSYIGQPYKLRNRRGQESTLSFDANGELKTIVGTGVNILRQFDGWDRLQNLYDFTYNSNPHTFAYDDLSRVTSLNGPWSDDTLAWEYIDSQRKVIRTSPSGVTETTTGDALGRISSIVNPLGTFIPGYDGDTSRMLGINHSGGFDTDFTHYGPDLDRALHTITSKLPGGSVISKHTYGYDNQSRINSWKRDATLANPSGSTRSFGWSSYYDFASQLTSVSEKSLGGTLQGGWDYGHDLAGNITTEQITSDVASPVAITKRTYNTLNQMTNIGGGGKTLIRGTLSEPGQVSVGLSGSGDKPARMLEGNRFETEVPLQTGSNFLSIAASDFSANRSNYQFTINVAAQSPRNPTYDDDGNLTADGIRSYEWDILSRLKKITWAPGNTTEFKYNALGQRCDRIDTDSGAVTKRYYLFDGITMTDSRSGTAPNTATIDRRYFAQGEQRKNGSIWESFIYCRDNLGCIREVVKSDSSTNTLVARYDYDPYGRRLAQYAASSYTGGCDFGYTGHVTVPSLESGQAEMVLTQFRAYDPTLNRWLSADPLGEAGGLNLYAYCYGNPLNFYDPDGMMPSAAWWGGFFDFDQGTLDTLGVGAMATADGFLPFIDPFQDSGGYDPCQDGVGFSKAAGGIARDAALAAVVPNVGAYIKNPVMYELGSTTVPTRVFNTISHLNPVGRGRILTQMNGGGLRGMARTAFGTSWKHVGSSPLITLGTGLTPGGNLAIIGGIHIADEMTDNNDCP